MYKNNVNGGGSDRKRREGGEGGGRDGGEKELKGNGRRGVMWICFIRR